MPLGHRTNARQRRGTVGDCGIIAETCVIAEHRNHVRDPGRCGRRNHRLEFGEDRRVIGRIVESLADEVTPLTHDAVRLEGPGCPLSAAVREQPLSCELVRAMLAAATGVEVTQRCEHGDTPRCCFDVATRS